MKWDKMDRKVWESSQVMRELEKLTVQNALDMANRIDQIKKANLSEVSKDLSQVNREAGPAKNNLEGIAKSVEKLYDADDGKSEDEVEKEKDKIIKELDEDCESLLKKALEKLSHLAADNGDTILAYKIERVIQEIEAESDED